VDGGVNTAPCDNLKMQHTWLMTILLNAWVHTC